MPASEQHRRWSKPYAGHRACRRTTAPSRRNASASGSMTLTVWLRSSRLRASVDPDAAAAHDHDVHAATTLTRHGPCRRRGASAHACRSTPQLRGCRRDVSKRILLGRELRSDAARRHPAAQAHRAAGLRQRRAVVGRLRPRRDLHHALGRRARRRTCSRWKIALAVALVMLTVVASYRQNVHAYPCGGGDYEVATVNLGPNAGLTVASALLVDYVLTVAVSVSSGVQNAASAMPGARGPRGRDRLRARRRAHRDEPARRAGVGRVLRGPDVRLHRRRARHGDLWPCSGRSRATCRRPRAPAW